MRSNDGSRNPRMRIEIRDMIFGISMWQHIRDDVGHGQLDDMQQDHFLNSTSNIADPSPGPQ